jgi:hypothetical protein
MCEPSSVEEAEAEARTLGEAKAELERELRGVLGRATELRELR